MQGVVNGNGRLSDDRFRLGQCFVTVLLLFLNIQRRKSQGSRDFPLHMGDFVIGKRTGQIVMRARQALCRLLCPVLPPGEGRKYHLCLPQRQIVGIGMAVLNFHQGPAASLQHPPKVCIRI